MAQYKSHNNKILCYMQHTLKQMNQIKILFIDALQINTMNCASKTDYFQFTKQHIMFHYLDWIKLYENATSFITGIKETIYITEIKNFLNQTNMKKSNKKNILDNIVKMFSLIVRANLNIFASAKTGIQFNQNAELQVISVSGATKIMKDPKYYIKRNEY